MTEEQRYRAAFVHFIRVLADTGSSDYAWSVLSVEEATLLREPLHNELYDAPDSLSDA